MREVSTDEITKNIKEMCIEANYILSDDVKNKIINSAAVENSEIGKSHAGRKNRPASLRTAGIRSLKASIRRNGHV